MLIEQFWRLEALSRASFCSSHALVILIARLSTLVSCVEAKHNLIQLETSHASCRLQCMVCPALCFCKQSKRAFVFVDFASIAPRMMRDYGRNMAAKDLMEEMDDQDSQYRLERNLPSLPSRTEEEIDKDLKMSAGPLWEQTAKQIQATEDGSQTKTYPLSYFSCFILCSCVNSEVSNTD